MLRAIAGYFFGGVEEEAPQTSVDCETREVNDWLVVNMADRPEDDIDMTDEIDIDLTTENEYDEILDAVSCLMRIDEPENDESFSDENSSETEEMESSPWDKSDDSFSINTDFGRELFQRSFAKARIQQLSEKYSRAYPFSLFNMSALPIASHEVVQNFQTDDHTCFLARSKPASMKLTVNHSYKYPPGINDLEDYKKAVKIINQLDAATLQQALIDCDSKTYPQLYYMKVKQVMHNMQKDNRTNLKPKIPEVTCQPLYSKSYVNHRNPVFPPKTDLMQKIKELEREQQIQDYNNKRFISKGQLNRQNKNYIFDSGCKKNRRKNLQRKPSGANNNRKC